MGTDRYNEVLSTQPFDNHVALRQDVERSNFFLNAVVHVPSYLLRMFSPEVFEFYTQVTPNFPRDYYAIFSLSHDPVSVCSASGV